jgi:hypothetical protein
MANKSYFIGPEDGWVKVITAGHAYSVRISAYPHTHPIYIFADPTVTPTIASPYVAVCHHPFKVENSGVTPTGGNIDAFWVRVPNSSNAFTGQQGRARVDVYTDQGTLA